MTPLPLRWQVLEARPVIPAPLHGASGVDATCCKASVQSHAGMQFSADTWCAPGTSEVKSLVKVPWGQDTAWYFYVLLTSNMRHTESPLLAFQEGDEKHRLRIPLYSLAGDKDVPTASHNSVRLQ